MIHAPDLQPVAEGLAQTRLADYSTQVREHAGNLRSGPAEAGLSPRKPNIILVGASLGGLLALMNAEQADALILVNPMPPAPLNLRLPDQRHYPEIIPWQADASIESTRRSIPDADDAACLYALRRWRDESGKVLTSASAGIVTVKPRCPVLVLASEFDADVPSWLSAALASQLGADLRTIAGASHVGPLLGRNAAEVARGAVAWLNESDRFR